MSQKLRRACGGLHHKPEGELRGEPFSGARGGDRLHRECEIGRGAAHHRGRGVEILISKLDHVSKDLQDPKDLYLPPGPADADHTATDLDREIGHHAQDRCIWESGGNPSGRSSGQQRDEDLLARSDFCGHLTQCGRLDRKHDDLGSLGQGSI